jgi:hypothetical protein
MRLQLALQIISLVISVQCAFGATYYVRTDGNNANAGTTDSAGGAWLTIQKAANVMAAGDTTIVGNGTFPEIVITKTNGASGSPVTFQGSGATKIYSFGLDHQFNYVDNFQVVTGGVIYAGIRFTTNNLRITRCYIDNLAAIPIRMINSSGSYPAAAIWPTNVYIAQCTITNCATSAKSISFNGSYSTIESNYITSNQQDAFNLYGGNNTIRWNTVTNILWDTVNTGDPNHNDWLQSEDIVAGWYFTNSTFYHNLAINCNSAIVQLQPNAATNDYHTLKFFNNVFINFTFNTSAGMPNCHWESNVFYKCATSNGFSSPLTYYAGDAQFRSNPSRVRNNAFVACGYQTNAGVAYTFGYTNAAASNFADYNFIAAHPEQSYAAISGYGAELNGVNGGNPLFVDIANGDARLSAGSPLIGEGEGGGDIGAFPFDAGSSRISATLNRVEMRGGVIVR